MRHRLTVSVLALLLTAAAPTAGWADPPDWVSRYRIVPRKSTLIESGGFTGWTQRYRVHGQFDFLQLWTPGVPGDPQQRVVEFDNANVYAPLGEMLPAFYDVDDLFNLEGLAGKLLPLGAPFDVYHFQGLGNTSAAASPLEQSRVDLYAAIHGRWMYLYGETTPPPYSADYPVYQLQALAYQGRWADWNSDGVIDAADYTVMRDLQSNPAAFPPDWDTEHALWSAQVGEREPDTDAMFAALSAALATSTALAVPEPSCLVLLALGVTARLTRRH
ncbi:hypothetical protein [Botrimarina mediterranea]|uniref:PEP-CTERM protein-sorting domain-containing protein n=1 Tax=Botrimarina mediterranea TaxID=2528022 RepID=A0A518KB51_9BACT|nr:hypothetical protein [Botrimarina mediterranea]QDV75013.1 hypothetical protein Spa11_32220 [Botrimarina mediterranea]QDV79660.1 hypothetical protein K2D_32750 [Planctomycetes bacterium K2D]